MEINQQLSPEVELEILNAIQTYSINAMQIKDRLTFLEETLRTLTTIFKQPKVFIFEINYVNQEIGLVKAAGFEGLELRKVIGIYPKKVSHLSIIELSDETKEVQDFFNMLNLKDATICEVTRPDLDYSGLIICGHSETDNIKNLIPTNQYNAFKLLVQKIGLINYLLRQNDRLSLELAERKSIEQKMAEQSVELKRSNEDLEQFAYVISHDLKAPLRNITSFAQLLKHQFSDVINPEAMEYLGFILTGVKQFGTLIDDLLIYSRVVKREIEFEETEFDLVVEAAKFNLRLLIEETATVVNYKNLPTLKVNFSQMTQVLQNLIANAIKFRKKNQSSIVNISIAEEDDDTYVFQVSDNGIGIETVYFQRIFSLFQRLHIQTEYEGTGLGLSICKKIIERHKGEIWVNSAGLDQGSTFFFTIPKNL